MVTCLLAILITTAVAVVLEVRIFLDAAKNALRAAKILRKLQREDPPGDEFYMIQSPVEESNMGDAFAPKTPAKLQGLDDQAKLKVLWMLTGENENRLDAFFARLHDGRELIIVSSWKDATDYRRVNLDYNRKTTDSILAKARRPTILATRPRFGIEHVRDIFRFKAVVYSFRDALAFVFAMDKSKELWPNGLSIDNVAKLDIVKLTEPKLWGWRQLKFDLVMPNHQLVECW